jgi:GNAT superfamily N-acetyltransferase
MDTASTHTLTFRIAGPADAEVLLSLLAQLESAPGPRLDPAQARAVLARMASYPSFHAWLCCRGDEVVGTYSLLLMDNLGHGGASAGVVENVVVDASRRGQGIGTAMMRHAMAICASHACYKLCLSSNQRRIAAHEFYTGLGFEAHGISFHIGLPAAERGSCGPPHAGQAGTP